jgi:hypothetical protein
LPWYSEFYGQIISAESGSATRAVLGSPGVGKSVFGLYFIARLILSGVKRYRGFPGIVYLVQKKNKADSYSIAIRLGEHWDMHEISEGDWGRRGEFGEWFAITDGFILSERTSIAILSPSQYRELKDACVRYMIVKGWGDDCISVLEGIGVGIDKVQQESRERMGTLRERVEVVGFNLRHLFTDWKLSQLKDYVRSLARAINQKTVPNAYFPQSGPTDEKFPHELFKVVSGEDPFWVVVDFASAFIKGALLLGLAEEKRTTLANWLSFDEADLSKSTIGGIFEYATHRAVGLGTYTLVAYAVAGMEAGAADLRIDLCGKNYRTLRSQVSALPRTAGEVRADGWYWRPHDFHLPGMDSILCTKEYCFFIQITRNLKHKDCSECLVLRDYWLRYAGNRQCVWLVLVPLNDIKEFLDQGKAFLENPPFEPMWMYIGALEVSKPEQHKA